MSILSAQHLSKSFGDRRVLHDVSLKINSGDIYCLAGKSGAGKSTLIRILAGLETPDHGTIVIDGEPLESPKDQLVPGHEEIRLVHQDFQLKHKMTVAENIRYEVLHYKKNFQQERVAELLALCKIEHLRDKDVALISGGEKQRVAIARALAPEPQVVLMDEPFSNLDLYTKADLLQEVKEIAKQTETAIVMITHDTRDAMEVADQLIILKDGEIENQGSAESLYRNPGSVYTASLFGICNVLSKNDLQKLGFNPDSSSDYFGFWPEDISIEKTPESLSGKVIHKAFIGHFHRVKISCDLIEQPLQAYLYDSGLSVGEQVQFAIHREKYFPLGGE